MIKNIILTTIVAINFSALSYDFMKFKVTHKMKSKIYPGDHLQKVKENFKAEGRLFVSLDDIYCFFTLNVISRDFGPTTDGWRKIPCKIESIESDKVKVSVSKKSYSDMLFDISFHHLTKYFALRKLYYIRPERIIFETSTSKDRAFSDSHKEILENSGSRKSTASWNIFIDHNTGEGSDGPNNVGM